MKTTKEIIEIIQAYEKGAQIQEKEIVDDVEYYAKWEDVENPLWNFENYDYRVKSKPKYVPFETVEELLEAQKKHGVYIKRIEDDVLFDIYVNYYSDHILLEDSKGNIENTLLSILYENYKFFDGTPCGKEVKA